MRVPLSLACLALLLAAGPLAAQDGKPMQGMPMEGMPMQGKPAQAKPAMDETNNPADAAFIAAMHDMMVGMHRSMPTGDTDRDFIRLMLPHHQSAVDMAKAEVKYGRDPDLKVMAQQIIDDQGREIALMKAWEDKHPK